MNGKPTVILNDEDLEDYVPTADEKAEFSEFYCTSCGVELDGTNGAEDSYVCYDCDTEPSELDCDWSKCACCGCVLTDDNAPVTGGLCHDCNDTL